MVFCEITLLCNLNCDFCYNIKSESYLMNNKIFERILDILKETDLLLHITGGEPTIHPKLKEYISLCKKNSLKYSISSNGTSVSKIINVLEKYKPISIHLSLDGNEQYHDNIRSSTGLYKNNMQIINCANINGIEVGVQFTVTSKNVSMLESEVLNMCNNLNVNTIKITKNCYIGNEIFDNDIINAVKSTHGNNKYNINVCTEVMNNQQLKYHVNKLINSQSMIVFKPNGYIHPYFGLSSDWDYIHVDDINDISLIDKYFKYIFLIILSKNNEVFNFETVDFNKVLYDGYIDLKNKKAKYKLNSRYIIRYDFVSYLYDCEMKSVLKISNVLGAVLDYCREGWRDDLEILYYLMQKCYDVDYEDVQKILKILRYKNFITTNLID